MWPQFLEAIETVQPEFFWRILKSTHHQEILFDARDPLELEKERMHVLSQVWVEFRWKW